MLEMTFSIYAFGPYSLSGLMDDYTRAAIGVGVIWGIGGICSLYEYYKCRKLLKDNPDQSFNDLYNQHHIWEQPILFFGIPGTEIARWKHYRAKE